MQVRPYLEGDAKRWDAFCDESINGTLLHTRLFLSYHANRFEDASLIVEQEGRWLGLIPAARLPEDARCVVSHPGITYGGFVHAGGLKGEAMVEAFRHAAQHFAKRGFSTFVYKTIPVIYHASPAQDDLYALSSAGACRVRCDLASCIDLRHPLPKSSRRLRTLRKATKSAISLEQGAAHLADLWPVLEANLACRHGAKPVHTLAEMSLLAGRFADRIRVTVARLGDQTVAGTVTFVTPTAHHAQYIAALDEGRTTGALDLVFDHQIRVATEEGRRYFSFGISTEDEGRRLNAGLHRFKSEFGATGFVHEFYSLELTPRSRE